MSDALDVDPAADDQVVAVVRRIAAPPETVFDYLVDPARFVLWMGVAADLDARPGGGYHITVGPDAVATGDYQVVDPPRRLVFTWGWRGDTDVPVGSTTVEILLTPEGEGTRLELRHRGLPGDQSRARHAEGWEMFLDRLTTVIGG